MENHLKLNSIHISLDEYDDIFSDFDPLPYSDRTLSDDFLKELRKHDLHEKDQKINIHFSIPKVLRIIKTESLIKKRLKSYFDFRFLNINKKMQYQLFLGIFSFLFGILLLAGEEFLNPFLSQNYLIPVIRIVLVTIGGYVTYVGFECMLRYRKLSKISISFQNLAHASFEFSDREDVINSDLKKNLKVGTSLPVTTGFVTQKIKIIHK